MAKRNSSQGMHSRKAMRNLQSAGWSAAKLTGRTTERAAVGLFRWAATDHSGMGRALANMPTIGLLDTIGFIFRQFLYAMAGAVLTGVWVFLLVAYGIPFLFFGHF